MILQSNYSGVLNSRVNTYLNSLFVSILLFMSWRKILRNMQFGFDYYIGYFLTNAHKHDVYREYMFRTYPEYFENELKYLKEKENERSQN